MQARDGGRQRVPGVQRGAAAVLAHVQVRLGDGPVRHVRKAARAGALRPHPLACQRHAVQPPVAPPVVRGRDAATRHRRRLRNQRAAAHAVGRAPAVRPTGLPRARTQLAHDRRGDRHRQAHQPSPGGIGVLVHVPGHPDVVVHGAPEHGRLGEPARPGGPACAPPQSCRQRLGVRRCRSRKLPPADVAGQRHHRVVLPHAHGPPRLGSQAGLGTLGRRPRHDPGSVPDSPACACACATACAGHY